MASAKQDRLESGATVRIDSTVTAALMHERSDSALLWDGVRLMTRLLRQAYALVDAPYPANLQAGAKAGTVKPNDDTGRILPMPSQQEASSRPRMISRSGCALGRGQAF